VEAVLRDVRHIHERLIVMRCNSLSSGRSAASSGSVRAGLPEFR